MPRLRSAGQTYGPRGLVVISVSDEDTFEIEPYLRAHGVDYPVVRAFGVGQMFGDTGVPHAWLISAAGTVTWSGHTNALPDAEIEAIVGTAIQPGASSSQQLAPGGDTWWIWLIIAPAILFAGAMGWFLWQSRDRTINYQTQIYQAPQPARPPGPPPPQPSPYAQQGYPPPNGQQAVPMNYGPPQAFPGTPGSSTIQEPYQGGARPGSKPNTRAIPRPGSSTQMPMPMPEPVELPPEPPPKAEHYFGQKPAGDFPPFDTNRNPQRGR